MRINAPLTALQKIGGDAICKVALTPQGGGTTLTYGVDTTNRILDLQHAEQEWSHTAQIMVDNRDNNLTAETLEGYAGIVSYGFDSTYSATAPLTVIAQKADSMQGELVTSFSLAGLFNMWSKQEATEAYSPDELNTDTVKTILDAIAAPSLTCFSDYPAHTINYDSGYDDSIINAFTPKEAFSIAKGESRLSAFRNALKFTKCKERVENDSSVATIHIFQHETSSYDYEYDDAYGDYHNFFTKSKRTRLVLPNKVVVMNHPAHEDSYTGSATDSSSYAALNNQYYTETVYVRPADNNQCALIAAAILLGYQLGAEQGHGFAPMNCGQEVFDYVNITDSRTGDTRDGNIGYLSRHYRPKKFDFEFRFGSLNVIGLAGTIPPYAVTSSDPRVSDAENMNILVNYVLNLDDRMSNLQGIINGILTYLETQSGRIEFTHLSVTERLEIPQGANKYT